MSLETPSDFSSSAPSSEPESAFSPKELLELFRRKKKLLLAVMAAAALVAVLYHVLFPAYKVTSYLLVDSGRENSGLTALLGSLGSEGMGNAAVNESEDDRHLLILRSESFGRELAQAVLKDPAYSQFQKELESSRSPMRMVQSLNPFRKQTVTDSARLSQMIARVRGAFQVAVKRRGILQINVKAHSPETCVFLTNHLLDTAVRVFSAREEEKMNEARAYIRGKIQETLDKLQATDEKIVGMSMKNATLSLLAPQSAISEKLLELKTEIQTLEFASAQKRRVLSNFRDRQKKIKDEASVEERALPGDSISTMFGLNKTISTLETEIELLDVRIQTLKKGLADVLKTNLPLPKEEQALADLKRQKGLDYYVFDNLFKTLLEIEVKGLSLISRVYPLQKVNETEVSITSGPVQKALVAVAASLLCALLGIYVYNLVNPPIRSKKDFESSQVSFLGNITLVDKNYLGSMPGFHHLCNFGIDSKETISFKQIRSRLVYLSGVSGTNPRKSIGFVSYGNDEGKSFLSSNLAACFSQLQKRILFIDFDLRRAGNTKLFHLEGRPGVCDFIDRGVDPLSLITPEIIPNLDMMPAGVMSPKTADYTTNQKIEQLLKLLNPHYDFIIFDTAPLLVAPETLIISQLVDFLVLVSTCWKTKREHAVDALQEIRHVRNSRVHVVINKTPEVASALTSNYYYVASHRTANRPMPLDN